MGNFLDKDDLVILFFDYGVVFWVFFVQMVSGFKQRFYSVVVFVFFQGLDDYGVWFMSSGSGMLVFIV